MKLYSWTKPGWTPVHPELYVFHYKKDEPGYPKSADQIVELPWDSDDLVGSIWTNSYVIHFVEFEGIVVDRWGNHIVKVKDSGKDNYVDQFGIGISREIEGLGRVLIMENYVRWDTLTLEQKLEFANYFVKDREAEYQRNLHGGTNISNVVRWSLKDLEKAKKLRNNLLREAGTTPGVENIPDKDLSQLGLFQEVTNGNHNEYEGLDDDIEESTGIQSEEEYASCSVDGCDL